MSVGLSGHVIWDHAIAHRSAEPYPPRAPSSLLYEYVSPPLRPPAKPPLHHPSPRWQDFSGIIPLRCTMAILSSLSHKHILHIQSTVTAPSCLAAGPAAAASSPSMGIHRPARWPSTPPPHTPVSLASPPHRPFCSYLSVPASLTRPGRSPLGPPAAPYLFTKPAFIPRTSTLTPYRRVCPALTTIHSPHSGFLKAESSPTHPGGGEGI